MTLFNNSMKRDKTFRSKFNKTSVKLLLFKLENITEKKSNKEKQKCTGKQHKFPNSSTESNRTATNRKMLHDHMYTKYQRETQRHWGRTVATSAGVKKEAV